MRPTYRRIREVLDYNPDSGLFRWRISGRGVRVGKIAGCAKNGYIEICVDYYRTTAHRFAWFWIMGSWPAGMDHKNRKRDDNRWCNLRLASHEENMRNKGVSEFNRLGIKGVYFNKRRFAARIWKDRRSMHLGVFDTAEEASAAYITAARELHGEFCYAASI